MIIRDVDLINLKIDGFVDTNLFNEKCSHGVKTTMIVYERPIAEFTHKVTVTAVEYDCDDAQELVVEYDMSANGDNEAHFSHTFHLEDYDNFDDLSYDVNYWVIDAKKDALELSKKENDEIVENEREIAEMRNYAILPYTKELAEETAIMMNVFNLSFVTTVENENPNLKRKPMFSFHDILEWFAEADKIIRKRLNETELSDDDDLVEYVNGPICVKAYGDGGVELSIVLRSKYASDLNIA